MAGHMRPQSEHNDRPLSNYEHRLCRALHRNPLSLAHDLQHRKSNYVANHACSSSHQDSQSRNAKDDAPQKGISDVQAVQPLKWPPKGLELRSKLSLEEAEVLVSKGAPTFKGFTFQTLNVPFRHSRFYALAGLKDGRGSLEASSKHSIPGEDVMSIPDGASETLMPWETLEQPSMTMCFGALPGTITINHWAGLISRHLPQSETDSSILFRPMPLTTILDRLKFLERGLDAYPEVMEDFLYSQLVFDPAKSATGENDVGRQIAVLIAVLDTFYWTDFSEPKAQVIAAYYETEDLEVVHLFFHQLMLSVELHLRIESTNFDHFEKRRFLSLLPDRVGWSVALAKIWLSNVFIKQANHIGFKGSWDFLPLVQVIPHNKLPRIKQVEQLGWGLKWPNMAQVCDLLEKEGEGANTLVSSSVEARSFLSGLILPGPSSSWLAVKCLIDCDTKHGHMLNGLGRMHPQSGFQYRNATYWYWSSIVGKVLGAAKGVDQHTGWVGPCLNSPDLERCTTDLERVHCVIADPDAVPTRLNKQKIKNMEARSHPLGPPDEVIPIDEFSVVGPKFDVVDKIRIERLACPLGLSTKKRSSDEPSIFNVAITFATGGASFALRLRHDTSYIKAVPCDGPHVLFWDYIYKSIRVDGLLDQDCWGGVDAKLPSTATAFNPADEPGPSNPHEKHDVYDDEAVLVVEAFGVADNEVFARAWCAYIGLSAIVANIEETCMACSIREAYAASVTVVILVDGRKDEDVEAVERSPPRPRKSRSRLPTH